MKYYLVFYTCEGDERGEFGDGRDYETYEVVKARTHKAAKKKILNDYGLEGVRVYKLSKRLRLKGGK